VPIVEIEHDGIGRRLGPAMLPNDLGGADHARILFFRRAFFTRTGSHFA
jgi:hypothetical protein